MNKNNDYDLVILTTACSRSELHSTVLSNIPSFLEGYKCKWIISIDEVLGEPSNVTKKYLQQLLTADHIDLEIVASGRKASRFSWFESVKFCINKGFEYKPKLGYFWLEDDWQVNTSKPLSTYVNKVLDRSYISLSNRNELSFNPCIWSIDLFKKYMYEKINNHIPSGNGGNAERVCVYKNKSPEPVNNINMIKYNIFSDAGRTWASKNIKGKRTFHLNEIKI